MVPVAAIILLIADIASFAWGRLLELSVFPGDRLTKVLIVLIDSSTLVLLDALLGLTLHIGDVVVHRLSQGAGSDFCRH